MNEQSFFGLKSVDQALTANVTGSYCSWQDAVSSPLNSWRGVRQNSLNPCFVALVGLILNAGIALFAVWLLCELVLFNSVGRYKLNRAYGSVMRLKSVGIYHWLRLAAAVIEFGLVLILLWTNYHGGKDIKSISLVVLALTLGGILLPLQIWEPTYSFAQRGPVLFYWLVNIGYYGAIVIQDIFSSTKIFVPSGSEAADFIKTVEILLLVNAIFILFAELKFWQPSTELKEHAENDDWDVSSIHNIFSLLSFYYVEYLITKIYNERDVSVDDLPAIPYSFENLRVTNLLEKSWQKEVARARKKRAAKAAKAAATGEDFNEEESKLEASLFWALFKTFLPHVLTNICIEITSDLLELSRPLLLELFIHFFTEFNSSKIGKAPPLIIGFSIAVGIFVVSVLYFITFNSFYMSTFKLGYKCESSLQSMIYKKALLLSAEARKTKTSGEIVNNISVDIERITFFFQDGQMLFTSTFKLILTLLALYRLMGNSVFAGILIGSLFVPLASKVSTSVSVLYQEIMKHRDKRTSLTSEILNSIKSVKFYAWEKPMLQKLDEIRNQKELVLSRKIGIFNSLSVFCWSSIPFGISCATFGTFAVTSGSPLTPEIVFPALSLFNFLSEPLNWLPGVIVSVVELRVSLKRLQDLFLMDETNDEIVEKVDKPIRKGDDSVYFKDASFVWSNKARLTGAEETNGVSDTQQPDQNIDALTDINFIAKKGQLTCIVGKVGSGKTTLIRAILGQVPLSPKNKNLKVTLTGSIAYCSQHPWIKNASVRENILFGCGYNKAFYDATVAACELLTDFEVLPDGDHTIVGEKGVSLSGGQKARISLARAVYSRSDVYLLDDVLSAVDAHVGKSIIDKVLGPKGLLASKTKVLATNSVNVLKIADQIVMMEKGSIIERGSFDQVKSNNSKLHKLIEDFGHNEESTPEKDYSVEGSSDQSDRAQTVDKANEASETHKRHDIETAVQEFAPAIEEGARIDEVALERILSNHTLDRASLVSYNHTYSFEDELDDKVKKTGHMEENLTRGKVKWSVFKRYFNACGLSYIYIYVIFVLFRVVLQIGNTYLLKYWSEINAIAGENKGAGLFLSLYVFCGVLGALVIFTSSYILWKYCIINASKYFHDTMAMAVLRSPMLFFETTPIGRILNRFSDDMNAVDEEIVWEFSMLLNVFVQSVILFSVIIYNIPSMGVVILLLGIIYNRYRQIFIPASRELKRLSSSSRSPVFSHVQESVAGVETITAFDQMERFIHKNKNNLNTLTNVKFMNHSIARWLSIRLQAISAIILFLSLVFSVITLVGKKPMSAALVGFLMANALQTVSNLTAIIRLWAEVETRVIALERVMEYCDLYPEAEPIIEGHRPPPSWPQKGAISFKDYTTRYRENLEPVLKNVSFDVKPQEKVGIVGRTGAGKSTLTLALYRMIEPTGGHIEIDGINTSELGLYDLRSNMCIIPQDAHTFEGTVRQNLDPFDKHTDDELWKVLELSHLKNHVMQMKNDISSEGKDAKLNAEQEEPAEGLNAKIAEGGSNLSSGQKQLLCLARALLNQSTVLILDEATAAVDVQTDSIIQQTIRSEFKDRTILTIAHRLDTILDSDRVLVLERGSIKEFASPSELLKDENSLFYSLCRNGGYLEASKKQNLAG